VISSLSFGPASPTTEADIVGPAIRHREGRAFHAATPLAEPTLRRLAGLKPSTIALMHGPAFKGDGGAGTERPGGLLRRAAQRLIVIPTEAKRSGGTSSLWRHD